MFVAKSEVNESTLMKALIWAYDQALAGVPSVGIESALELAEDYRRRAASPAMAAQSLVRWQVTKAGTAGFLTGLGGVLSLPVTLPLNLASVLVLQLRMIAAIAQLGGHDVRSDQVRTMAFACMCGNAAADVLKNFGIQLGSKLTQQGIRRLSGEVVKKVNQKVGFRLVTKFGQKGLVNLGKMIPVVGGIVGGGFDASSTLAIGTVARRMFIAEDGVDVDDESAGGLDDAPAPPRDSA